MNFEKFNEITLNDQVFFTTYFKKYPIPISEYTFTNLFIWRDYYKFKWMTHEETLILISNQYSDKILLFPPLGPNWISCISTLQEMAKILNKKLELHRFPETYLELIQKAYPDVEIIEDRANWDYIYNRRDLVSLEGKKYTNLRKKINKFKSRNIWQYLPISSAIVNQLVQLQDIWCKYRACSDDLTLEYENIGIIHLLNNWDMLNLQGGAIYVDNQPIAYSIGEVLSNKTFVVHIEKASSDYQGSYQVMAHQFYSHLDSQIMYINREQDLGDAGLRRSKEQYHPSHFIKKYQISFTL